MPKVKSKPISIHEANKMFASIKEMRSRTREKMEMALKSDNEASRYFLGEEVAFFFNKASLKRLWNTIKDDRIFSDENSGFILYMGSRFDDDLGIFGRPTLMAFAYEAIDDADRTGSQTIHILAKNGQHINFDPHTSVFTVPSGELDPVGDGEEHPGGGFIPPTPGTNGSPHPQIPIEFPDTVVHTIP